MVSNGYISNIFPLKIYAGYEGFCSKIVKKIVNLIQIQM